MTATETQSSAVEAHFEAQKALYEKLTPAQQEAAKDAKAALVQREQRETEIVKQGLADIEKALQAPDANPDTILSQLQALAQIEVTPTPEVPEAPAVSEVPAPPAPPEAESPEKDSPEDTPAPIDEQQLAEIRPTEDKLSPLDPGQLQNFSESMQKSILTIHQALQALIDKPAYPRIMDDLSAPNIRAGILRFQITLLSARLDAETLQKLFSQPDQTCIAEMTGFGFTTKEDGSLLFQFDENRMDKSKIASKIGLSLETYTNANQTLNEVLSPADRMQARGKGLLEDLHKILKKDPEFLNEWLNPSKEEKPEKSFEERLITKFQATFANQASALSQASNPSKNPLPDLKPEELKKILSALKTDSYGEAQKSEFNRIIQAFNTELATQEGPS